MKGKIVRRLAAAGLSAVVAASAAAPVFAADKSYKISAISDMNITLPDNITVIDRDAPDSAEYFKLFGVDYNTVMSQMNSNNVYLQGMDNTASLTVTDRELQPPQLRAARRAWQEFSQSARIYGVPR